MLHKSQDEIYEPELSGTLHGLAYRGDKTHPPFPLCWIYWFPKFHIVSTKLQVEFEWDKLTVSVLKLYIQTKSSSETRRISDVNYREIRDENVGHFEVEIMGSNIKDNFGAVFSSIKWIMARRVNPVGPSSSSIKTKKFTLTWCSVSCTCSGCISTARKRKGNVLLLACYKLVQSCVKLHEGDMAAT